MQVLLQYRLIKFTNIAQEYVDCTICNVGFWNFPGQDPRTPLPKLARFARWLPVCPSKTSLWVDMYELAHPWIPIFRWANLKLSNARLGDMPVISYAATHEYHPRVRERTKVIDIINTVRKMKWFWAGHTNHLKDDRWTSRVTTWRPLWQEKTTRETSQAVERRPRQILEWHDMAVESTRQGNLETACWGLRPTTGHNGCLMMMMMI